MKDFSLLYELGIEKMNKDLTEEAYECFLEGALRKEVRSCMSLGFMYLSGMYPKRDYKKAFKYLKTALDYADNDEEAAFDIVYSISDQIDDIAKDKKARKYYIDFMNYLLEKEIWDMYITVAYEYGSGKIYPKDIEKEIEYLEIAAEHGIEYGYECLGELFYLGEEVERDYNKAYEYFMKSKKKCSNVKPYYLGEMYREGILFEKDIDKAKEYYQIILDDERAEEYGDVYYIRAVKRMEEITEGEIFNAIMDEI